MAGDFNIWGSDQHIMLRWKGTTDMDEVQRACREWFSKRKFEFHEHFVKAKQPTPVGEEIFWRWMAFRNISEYLRFQTDIHWHFWDWEQVEVMQDGKKKILSKGRCTVTIKGKLITDYNDRFEGSAFKHALREFIDKYLFLMRLHFWSSHFEYAMHDFFTMLKGKLGMQLHETAYHGVR